MVSFGKIVSIVNPILNLFIKNQPFFNIEYVPNSKLLESNWEIIRGELLELLKDEDTIPPIQSISKTQEYLTTDKKWKAFFLKIYGNYIDKNCATCPLSTEIIKKIPNVSTAFFSILDGHKHISKHEGSYKGVLRCHLGLITPKDKKSKISVGGEIRYWEEGKALLFDDTYPHEVWNDSDEKRVVLLLDIERPLPYKWLQKLNRTTLRLIKKTDFIQEAVEKAQSS